MSKPFVIVILIRVSPLILIGVHILLTWDRSDFTPTYFSTRLAICLFFYFSSFSSYNEPRLNGLLRRRHFEMVPTFRVKPSCQILAQVSFSTHVVGFARVDFWVVLLRTRALNAALMVVRPVPFLPNSERCTFAWPAFVCVFLDGGLNFRHKYLKQGTKACRILGFFDPQNPPKSKTKEVGEITGSWTKRRVKNALTSSATYHLLLAGMRCWRHSCFCTVFRLETLETTSVSSFD